MQEKVEAHSTPEHMIIGGGGADGGACGGAASRMEGVASTEMPRAALDADAVERWVASEAARRVTRGGCGA